MKLFNYNRCEYAFLALAGATTIVLTVWFPFRAYFLVSGNVEQVEIDAAEVDQPAWPLGDFEMINRDGEKVSSSGELTIFAGSRIVVRRISRSSTRIFISEGAAVQFRPQDLNIQPRTLPVSQFPMTIVVERPKLENTSLVLPIRGNVTIGRSTTYAQSTPERPIIRSGVVEIQARAIDGRSVVSSTDQKLFPADFLEFTAPNNGNGMLHVSDEPGMTLFYSVNAAKGLVRRYGADEPVAVKPSFLGRITSDPVLGGMWAGFVFIAGAVSLRRALLEKK